MAKSSDLYFPTLVTDIVHQFHFDSVLVHHSYQSTFFHTTLLLFVRDVPDFCGLRIVFVSSDTFIRYIKMFLWLNCWTSEKQFTLPLFKCHQTMYLVIGYSYIHFKDLHIRTLWTILKLPSKDFYRCRATN